MRDYYGFVRAVRDGCLRAKTEQPTHERLGTDDKERFISWGQVEDSGRRLGLKRAPCFCSENAHMLRRFSWKRLTQVAARKAESMYVLYPLRQ